MKTKTSREGGGGGHQQLYGEGGEIGLGGHQHKGWGDISNPMGRGGGGGGGERIGCQQPFGQGERAVTCLASGILRSAP